MSPFTRAFTRSWRKHRSVFSRLTLLHVCFGFLILAVLVLAKTSGPVSLLNAHAAAFSGTPYTGTAITLPGRIEVENYDNGGEGVAYHDTTATNDGGAYRAEGVDVCTCGSPYGLSVGWTQPGEWMEYTVAVSSYGVYKFQPLTATTVSGTALHVEVDGVNVTGQMTLPNTGAWGSYAPTSSPAVTLTAGQHIVRVAVDVTGFLIDSVDVIRLNTPYGGTATVLPGTVPAENFDNGGEGIAYHDTTTANEGGAYRSEGVDLCACGNADGAALGWSQVGEWTRYTVNVSTTDTYTLQARISTITTGCAIHLEVDGVNVTGQMALPNTGAWNAWTTISKPNVQISAGQHELKMVIEGAGFLLDSLSAIPSVPIAPSSLTANAVSTSQINLAWTDNSFNESGFKIERKTGTSGTYSEITTIAAGVTSFNDTGRQPSTQYFYRVRATNLGGDSAYSNEASAMTSNLLPSVSVTAPSGGSVFTAPANVTLNASASDADGTVAKVEFFQGSTKLGEDLTAPYSFSWTNVSAGTYSLTAKATDNLGGVTTSAPVAITVNALPTISLTAPAANTVFTSPANFTITASASDSDGSISKVEFFAGAGLLGQDTTAPYSFTMSNASHGTYVLTAKATDNNGGVTTSAAVSAIVTDAPTTNITSPANNAVLTAGANIVISATAADDGSVAKVEFLNNGVVLGEDATSPYSFTWNAVPAGSYSLTTRVTDDLGITATSSAVNINVIAPSGISRLDPMNRTGTGGEDPLSRNFNWTLPLVNLPGRAGMDLSLSLSYNSLVWTRTGNYISFDDDHGFPSPGFRLGFPVIQQQYFNAEVGKDAYLLIGADGSRTELRRVGTSTLFEAADSSHLLLDANTMILRSTDGTQMTYSLAGTDFNCTQIKDRNGNYITINYASGQIANIHDTLDRVITFNYENGLLSSITQTWKKPSDPSQTITHTWASFAYADLQIQTNFSGLSIIGAVNGATKKVLSKVTLDDNSTTPAQNSHFDFDYTSWGQVWKINNFAADNHLLNYRSYNLPQTAATAYTDCPRFTERHDFAENWNQNSSGVEQEAITTYAAPASDSWTMPDNSAQTGMRAQVTRPDLTSTKIYFVGTAGTASGWQRGLPALLNTYDSSGVLQRQAMTTWTQDDTTVSFPLNPRVLETNIYDPAGNRARVQMTYQQVTFANGTSCQLPRNTYEYAANASTILRSTQTDYNTSSPYTDRRIIGVVSEKRVYEGDVNNGGTLVSKVGFFYDNDNGASSIQGTDAPVQHDNTNYSASFVTGRANLSSVRRYDVNNTAQFTTISSKYNTAGAPVLMADALNHTTQLSYTDSFADGISRNTLAYPTRLTDPDNYTSTANYNFDFGAVTYRRTPQPNTTQNLPGPEQIITFDDLGRLQQVVNQVNSAYTRYVYSAAGTRVDTYATIQDGLGEAHSFQITDGAGRVIGTATDHPGSVGGYSGRRFSYDVMGRTFETSNATETSASGMPSQWTTAGDDAAAGWIYTQQTYDWKGRPLVTRNQDGTTKTASYAGCGCAGGEVVTITDEGTLQGGLLKTRQQKIYSDVLGRTAKTEVLDWDGTGPGGVGRRIYSATVNTYNARDQITVVRQYAGAEGSGTYQDTTMNYDGYGRLLSKHVPEQDVNTATVWTYNVDDTINTITDARGAVTTYGYSGTNRQLVKQVTQTLSGSPTISTSFTYDATGNRLSMSDGFGLVSYAYDQLARLTSEIRSFNGVGSFSINYTYNLAGQLLSVTDPFGASFSYTRDVQGRLKTVSGSPYAGTTTYVNDVAYRAWGAPKTVSYNGTNSTVSFNARLQPTQFRLTANGSGASIIRENYSYFPDARLNSLTDLDDTAGTNPPVSLRFLSRAYTYDHAGRVSFVYGTGGAGQGVPFNQSYLYDEFDNMKTRSGNYYNYNSSGPATDTASYTNNRRSNWTYNAEGQVISTPLTSTDRPRTMTYDAADRMVTTVQSNQFNTVTYSASYDGDGQLVYETSNTSPGSSSASYIVRSTVLGGEVLTRLDQFGNKLITHVPAEGLLFATQRSSGAPGAYVDFTYRNPLGITETSKAVYDPLGNYIPFQTSGDPRPPVGSYNSGSMSGLSSSEADPSSFGVGCIMDGMPTNCRRVMMVANNGRGNELTVYGLALSPTITRLMLSGTEIPPQSQRIGRSVTLEMPDGRGVTFTLNNVELTSHFIIAPGMQRGFEQNPHNPLNESGIQEEALAAIAQKPCIDFANAILGSQKRKGLGTFAEVAKSFFALSAPHFTRNRPPNSIGVANPIGNISSGTAQIYLIGNDPTLSADQQTRQDADFAVSELFHLAAKGDYYTDEDLARAVNKSSYAADAYRTMKNGKPLIDPTANIFDPRYIANKSDPDDRAYSFSAYFHTIQHLYCTTMPESERGIGARR